MPKRTRAATESEDLQSFLNNFHKEIEDGDEKVVNKILRTINDEENEEEEPEEEDNNENDDDIDEDKYFIDDEGNCYIKTTPKMQEELKKKLLKKAAAGKAKPATKAAAPQSSSRNKTSVKAINLHPAETSPKHLSNKANSAVVVRPAQSAIKPKPASPPPPPTVETILPDVITDEVVEEHILEELIDDPDNAQVETISFVDEFEFDEQTPEVSKPEPEFAVTGKQYKLAPRPTYEVKAVEATSTLSKAHKFSCSHCTYTSNKKFLITRHLRIHVHDFGFKCSICDRGFKSNAGLINHVNTHMGNKPHKCKSCEKAFTTSGELVRHTRYKHTKDKPHKCTECNYASVELTKLRRHMTCHTGERPFQCPHCTYASQDMFKLKRHSVIHTGEKKYQCDICKALFTQSNSLKAHKLIHSVVDKPVFQCSLCPTTCGRKADLRTHVANMHTSDKPHVCKRCGQQLPDRYQYKLHVKTHEGEKCYACTVCSYASVSKRHLDSHMLIHFNEKPFMCDYCNQTFRQRQLLRHHINTAHDKDYKPPAPRDKVHNCPSCPRVFANKGNLMRHMETHDNSIKVDKERLKLKLGRKMRVKPNGTIVHLIGDKEVEGGAIDISTDEDDNSENFELCELQDQLEAGDELEVEAPKKSSTRPVIINSKQKPSTSSSAPVIINQRLKKPAAGKGFQIKEEPETTEFTVKLRGEDGQVMVVELINDAEEAVVKREPKGITLDENNFFGFEDDVEPDYDEFQDQETEVDGTSQEFLQLMDMIEQEN